MSGAAATGKVVGAEASGDDAILRDIGENLGRQVIDKIQATTETAMKIGIKHNQPSILSTLALGSCAQTILITSLIVSEMTDTPALDVEAQLIKWMIEMIDANRAHVSIKRAPS